MTELLDVRPHGDRELRLLMHCARATIDAAAAAEIRTLVAGGINWQRLLTLAGRHGLMPLLNRHLGRICPEAIPEARLAQLRDYARRNGAAALVLTGELLRLLAKLEDGGIEAMPIKGPALAARLYGEVGLRRFGDLDVLVRARDVWRASAILQTQGFTPDYDVSVTRREAFLRGDYVRLFRAADDQTIVELHWGIARRSFAVQFDETAVWHRSGGLALQGRTVPTPSDEDLLLMLCIHGARHAWDKLEGVAAIAELMRSSPALDWTYVWRKAGDTHCRRMVCLGLLLAHGLFDAAWPAEVPPPHRERSLAGLARAIARTWRDVDPAPAAFVRQAAFNLRLKDCLADRARSCARVFLTPTAEDWTSVPLRRPWSLAYPLVRAVRVARRHATRRQAAAGVLGAVLAIVATPPALAQDARPPRATAARTYTLDVKNDGGFIDVALRADRAPLGAIAADLGERLGVPVVVGSSLARETVTVQQAETSLEAVLSALAPHVLVDYMIRGGARPAPAAIYLLGPGDADPPKDTVARGPSQGVLITGNTETTEGNGDDPLQITGDRGLLSLTVRKQPLPIVAMALGDVLGVPVEIQFDAPDLVDAQVRQTPTEDVVAGLSPNLRLYMRVEVIRLERTPLRLVVARPDAPQP